MCLRQLMFCLMVLSSRCEGDSITLSQDAVVLYENMELSVYCIRGVAAAPQCIGRWHGEEDRFEGFDSEVITHVFVYMNGNLKLS